MTLAERPPGGVTSLVLGGDLLVWLHGEIDLSLRPALDVVSAQVRGHRGALVVDTEGLTFCDGTLAGFLAEAAGLLPVTVRGPNRLIREFLRLYCLEGVVSERAD